MGIYSDGKYNGGLWFTGSYSKTDYDMGKTNSLVDGQKFTSGTIGYDKKIRAGNGTWWTGLMAGYGKADRDLSYGLGDSGIDSFHASLYGIYRADSGLYAAGLIKYNRYSTDYTITHPDSYTCLLYTSRTWRRYFLSFLSSSSGTFWIRPFPTS